MKMHCTISPIGFAPNARGMSRLTGFVLSALPTTPVHFGVRPQIFGPQPFGRSRRF
jgi:hypothetical protein